MPGLALEEKSANGKNMVVDEVINLTPNSRGDN